MATWTDWQLSEWIGIGGTEWEKMKELSKKYIYIYINTETQITLWDHQMEKEEGYRRRWVKRGGNRDEKRLCLGPWVQDAVCRWGTWSLYDSVNQCNPNELKKKNTIQQSESNHSPESRADKRLKPGEEAPVGDPYQGEGSSRSDRLPLEVPPSNSCRMSSRAQALWPLSGISVTLLGALVPGEVWVMQTAVLERSFFSPLSISGGSSVTPFIPCTHLEWPRESHCKHCTLCLPVKEEIKEGKRKRCCLPIFFFICVPTNCPMNLSTNADVKTTKPYTMT